MTESESRIEVEKSFREQEGIYCTVQQLSVMLLGYKRPRELYDIGLIQGKKEEVEVMERLIPEQQTFFTDFY